MDDKIQQARAALATGGALEHFMSRSQRRVLDDLLRGEEREAFADTVLRVAQVIETMPKTYEQSELEMDAVAYLHYFRSSADFWITEKDMGDGSDDLRQHQAFGLASLFGGGAEDAELGYISIQEILDANVELDLYWEPKKLRDLS